MKNADLEARFERLELYRRAKERARSWCGKTERDDVEQILAMKSWEILRNPKYHSKSDDEMIKIIGRSLTNTLADLWAADGKQVPTIHLDDEVDEQDDEDKGSEWDRKASDNGEWEKIMTAQDQLDRVNAMLDEREQWVFSALLIGYRLYEIPEHLNLSPRFVEAAADKIRDAMREVLGKEVQ